MSKDSVHHVTKMTRVVQSPTPDAIQEHLQTLYVRAHAVRKPQCLLGYYLIRPVEIDSIFIVARCDGRCEHTCRF